MHSDPNNACTYEMGTDTKQGMFGVYNDLFSLAVNCPEQPDRYIAAVFTDTAENWEQTTFACSNLQIAESTDSNDDVITKTFLLESQDYTGAFRHVSFSRPVGLPIPQPSIGFLAYGAYEMPDNAAPLDCAANPVPFAEEEECGPVEERMDFGAIMQNFLNKAYTRGMNRGAWFEYGLWLEYLPYDKENTLCEHDNIR